MNRGQPWIHSAALDGLFILLPAFASTLFIWLAKERAIDLDTVTPGAWLLLIVGVDVAHVYATLYRTYFDPRELAKRRNLYVLAPLLGWVVGTLLYTAGALAFWRTLAYLAVFHFVRQQYGFAMIYSRGSPGNAYERAIDRAAVYLATLYPLIYWHTHLPRRFNWFVEGDFAGLPAWLDGPCFAVYVAALTLYFAKELRAFVRHGQFNLPRNLLILGTALSWWVGIVKFDGDLAFTATNVLAHGIPYLALVWIHGRNGVSREPGRRMLLGIPARILFSPGLIPLFVGLLVTLAFVEEGLWEAFVWRDHAQLFSAFAWIPRVTDRAFLSWLVPLLALPQITHYLLDGFLWKRKDVARSVLASGGPA